MAVLRDILRPLAQAHIRFVVVGGVAVVLHGHLRATKDLDLVIDLEPDEARKALSVLLQAGLRPAVPVNPFDFADPKIRKSWIDEKNMVVFQMIDPADIRRAVDLFATYPIDFEGLWARSVLLPIDDVVVRVASIGDLKRMKQSTSRPLDLDDIAQLEKLETLDDSQT